MNRSTKYIYISPFYPLYSLVLSTRERNEFFVERDDRRETLRHVLAGGNYTEQLVADTYRVSKYCCHQQTRAVRIRERAILIRYRTGARYAAGISPGHGVSNNGCLLKIGLLVGCRWTLSADLWRA